MLDGTLQAVANLSWMTESHSGGSSNLQPETLFLQLDREDLSGVKHLPQSGLALGGCISRGRHDSAAPLSYQLAR